MKLIRRGQALLDVGNSNEQVDKLPNRTWGAVRNEDDVQVYLVHQEDIGGTQHDGSQLVNLINRADREKRGHGYVHRMRMIDTYESMSIRAYAIPLVAKTNGKGETTYRAIEETIYRIVGLVRLDGVAIDAVIRPEPFAYSSIHRDRALT